MFLHAGGKAFHYIPCSNDDAGWIAALGTLPSVIWRRSGVPMAAHERTM